MAALTTETEVVRIAGTVLWWGEHGFGYVKASPEAREYFDKHGHPLPEDKGVFIHWKMACRPKGFVCLAPGQSVEYTPQHVDGEGKGWQATDFVVLPNTEGVVVPNNQVSEERMEGENILFNPAKSARPRRGNGKKLPGFKRLPGTFFGTIMPLFSKWGDAYLRLDEPDKIKIMEAMQVVGIDWILPDDPEERLAAVHEAFLFRNRVKEGWEGGTRLQVSLVWESKGLEVDKAQYIGQTATSVAFKEAENGKPKATFVA